MWQINTLFKSNKNEVNFIQLSQEMASFTMPAHHARLKAHVFFDNVSISELTFKLI